MWVWSISSGPQSRLVIKSCPLNGRRRETDDMPENRFGKQGYIQDH